MEPQVADLLAYKNTAKEMWEKAEKLYGHRKNYSHIYQIQQEIQQVKQQGKPIMEIFGYLQKKKDELTSVDRLTESISASRAVLESEGGGSGVLSPGAGVAITERVVDLSFSFSGANKSIDGISAWKHTRQPGENKKVQTNHPRSFTVKMQNNVILVINA